MIRLRPLPSRSPAPGSSSLARQRALPRFGPTPAPGEPGSEDTAELPVIETEAVRVVPLPPVQAEAPGPEPVVEPAGEVEEPAAEATPATALLGRIAAYTGATGDPRLLIRR